jgi:hypothetical protein
MRVNAPSAQHAARSAPYHFLTSGSAIHHGEPSCSDLVQLRSSVSSTRSMLCPLRIVACPARAADVAISIALPLAAVRSLEQHNGAERGRAARELLQCAAERRGPRGACCVTRRQPCGGWPQPEALKVLHPGQVEEWVSVGNFQDGAEEADVGQPREGEVQVAEVGVGEEHGSKGRAKEGRVAPERVIRDVSAACTARAEWRSSKAVRDAVPTPGQCVPVDGRDE